MTELKTTRNQLSVVEFIEKLDDEGKKQDSLTLLKLLGNWTGYTASMWGSSIIGFGSYHYKSQRSSQEGDWPLVGFSPRKQSLTIYIMSGFEKFQHLLEKIGKHKTSVSCLYVKKLADLDMEVLKELVLASVAQMKKDFPHAA